MLKNYWALSMVVKWSNPLEPECPLIGPDVHVHTTPRVWLFNGGLR